MKTATLSMSRDATATPPSTPTKAIIVALFIFGACALVIVANFFAARDFWRLRLDATKTRAYSLSPQSQQLVAGLHDQWEIALVLNSRKIDRNTRRQVDEVLTRFTDANPHLSVLRIDPDDPRSLTDYQGLVADLRRVYGTQAAEYDKALDAGTAAFNDLLQFAQQQAGVLQQVLERVPASDPTRSTLQQRIALMVLLSEQGGKIVTEIDKARRTDPAKPIPDYETARSILAEALSQWARQLDEMSQIFAQWRDRPGADASVKKFGSANADACTQLSQRLAEAADPLKRLHPLELNDIGMQLQQGEAVVIVGPNRAASIPSWQLFPKSFQDEKDGVISVDQRFRGEQIIASTIRSLIVDRMPMVVFVHGEDRSLIRPSTRDETDLTSLAAVLKGARYEVAEWMVASQPEPPSVLKGQPVAWVMLPPTQRKGLEVSRTEQTLLAIARKLIDEGQPVLLNLYPNLGAAYGQTDPWAALLDEFGLQADTSRVMLERKRMSNNKWAIQRGVEVSDYPSDHLISRALSEQGAYFTLAVPIQKSQLAPASGDSHTSPIATVRPSENVWLEKNWAADDRTLEELTSRNGLAEPTAIAMAAERVNPNSRAAQRFIVVGSGGWLRRFVTDSVLNLGAGKTVFQYPGNFELALASIAWLANMDDLIAASPISQGGARLQDLPNRDLVIWRYAIVGGIPMLCLLAGLAIHLLRRT